jgi:serine/threonine protein kinase
MGELSFPRFSLDSPMDELQIFSEALNHDNATERARYLESACGADAALRLRIERLLEQHDSDSSLLNYRPVELLVNLQDQTLDTLEGDPAVSGEAALAELSPFLTASPRPAALGRLGHYDLLEFLGQGGFGIVFKAFDNALHRVVAIKILAPHLAVHSPARKRFLREAQATAQIKHENVVQIYAVEEQPLPYLVMEFIDGQTLQERLRHTGPLEPAEVVRLGSQIARGLAAAHEKGLIHRDVKPANVLQEAGVDKKAKLTDFGLARAADDASLSQSGVITGTPLYMSPEQAQAGELDYRSDLFSLGSVLYALTTGHPPFRAPTTLAVLKRVTEDTPRPIPQVISGIPPGLCAVIMRLLEKNPARRFASANEVAEALTNCLTQVPIRSRWRATTNWTLGTLAVLLLAAPLVAWMGMSALAGLRKTDGKSEEQQARNGPNGSVPVGANPPEEPTAPRAHFVVTSEQEDGPGSLREALAQANEKPLPQIIVFSPALAGRTITLVEGWKGPGDRSALRIASRGDITIDGGKGVTLELKSPAKRRLIEVESHAMLTLKNLTLTGGNVVNDLDGGQIENQGGAVLITDGVLVVDHCTLQNNRASIGGAISAEFSSVTLRNSTFDTNNGYSVRPPFHQQTGGGGAVNFSTWNNKKYTLDITGCTFSNNVGTSGGAVWTRAEAASCSISHSTFVGNRCLNGFGAAIHNSCAQAVFLHLTIVDNHAENKGGALSQYATPLTLANSLVANNKAAGGELLDVVMVNGGTLTAGSRHNLIGVAGADVGLSDGDRGNRLGVKDLKIGPLADNGGPTKTIALLPGSPALEAGDPSAVPASNQTDQRGRPRFRKGKVDVGAYQAE